MEPRPIGQSGLEIAPLVFGGNVFGWTADERTSHALIDTFVDGGFNCIDTADVYSSFVPGNVGGESETIIGSWLARGGRRDRIVIATKCGLAMGPGKKGLSRARILEAAEESLRRLKTDYIDLYQAHVDDPEVPMEETLGAFAELVRSGKVRAIGASNFSSERLSAALDLAEREGLPRYDSLQPCYNLYDRSGFEGATEEICVKRGVGVLPYYALAAGFLTGKYRTETDVEGTARAFMVRKYLDERGRRILDALDAVAGELSAAPSQVALAWLVRRPSVTAPIASATSRAQLEELMKGVRLTLTETQLARLNEASRPAPAMAQATAG